MEKTEVLLQGPSPGAAVPEVAQSVKELLLVAGLPDHLNRNLAIRDSVAEAFAERLGRHRVHVAPLARAEERLDKLQNGFVLVFASVLADECDFSPLAHAARRLGLPVVFWLTDDPYEIDAMYKFIDIADLVFTNDRWSLTYYPRPVVHHLPLAASRKRHYREVLERDQEYTCDIFFCGVGFANRQSIIDGLQPVLSQYNTIICGADWKENAPYICNQRLANDELIDHYQRSRIVLNLARDFSYANDRYRITPSTPGPRTFEAAMAGGFQMIFADRPEIMEYYDLDREIVMFGALGEFDAKVRHYLDHPDERIAIARAAQARTIRDHQYINRVSQMLSYLSD